MEDSSLLQSDIEVFQLWRNSSQNSQTFLQPLILYSTPTLPCHIIVLFMMYLSLDAVGEQASRRDACVWSQM